MRMRTATAAALGLWLAVGLAVAVLPGGEAEPGSGLDRLALPAGADGTQEGPATTALPAPDGHVVLLAALTPFPACDDLLAHVQEHALEQVGPYGLGGLGYGVDVLETETADAAADSVGGAARTAAAPQGGDAGTGFSGTNVQEAGVDEPDLVKTDGRILYTAVDDRIRTVDISGDVPVLLDELRLDGEAWGAQLLLAGDRLLVVSTAHRPSTPPGRPLPVEGERDALVGIAPMGTPVTTVTLVDTADPRALRVVETLTVDGQHLSARVVDGLVRMVVRADPAGLPFVQPQGGGLRAEEAATERNREVIRASTVEQWLPYAIHVDAAGTRTEGTLVDCEAVSRPRDFSGLATVSVVTLDPAAGAQPSDVAAVLGGGETISASTDRLYVATTRWIDPSAPTAPPDDLTTEIHAFDITAPRARHVGSGAVPGTLLNQFSLSEHLGVLRVATTEGFPWGGGDGRPQESRVTVLAERDGALVEVGAVGGLGLDERIYAVRFLGDVGYVVTFREVDPLYTIDLRDPTAPRVRGELKIPGYSAYLHPLGDGLVLGVGQDATEDGRSLGAQVSLFDVADLAAPRRLATLPFGEGSMSDVEHDHRAFLHWPATGLTVVPVQRWRWDEATQTEDVEMAAVGLVADRDGLREVGRVSHLQAPAAPVDGLHPGDAWEGAIQRAVVTGDRLVTVSRRGVLVSDVGSLAPRGFAPFGAGGR